MSISGGVYKALERGASIGCGCVQLFTKSSNQWRSKPYPKEEIEEYARQKKRSGIDPVVAHASYLINLASPDDVLYEKSCDSFLEELARCDLLGIPYIVIHPGSHKESGVETGIKRVSGAVDGIYARNPNLKVMTLLETTAGQGTNLGASFEELAAMIESARVKERLGVCFDTCHVFSAGYEIRSARGYSETIKRFDRVIGLSKLRVIHLNDAKKGLGSRIDRHEHIGKGEIGLEGFKNLINDPRFEGVPMILETPKDEELRLDVMNLKTLKKLVGKK